MDPEPALENAGIDADEDHSKGTAAPDGSATPELLAFAAGEMVLVAAIEETLRCMLRRPDITAEDVAGIGQCLFGICRLPQSTPSLGVTISLTAGDSGRGTCVTALTLNLDENELELSAEGFAGRPFRDGWADSVLMVGKGFREYGGDYGYVGLLDWIRLFREHAEDLTWGILVEVSDSVPLDPALEKPRTDHWRAADDLLGTILQGIVRYDDERLAGSPEALPPEISEDFLPELRAKYGDFIRPDVCAVRLFQCAGRAYLDISTHAPGRSPDSVSADERVVRTDLLPFGKLDATGTAWQQQFSPCRSPHENAARFVAEVDAEQIAVRFGEDLFTPEATDRILPDVSRPGCEPMTTERPTAPRCAVAQWMLDHWNSQPEVTLANVIFASEPEANALVKEDPVAFLIAGSIDRRGRSELIYNVPLCLRQAWGHLDPARIATMDVEALAGLPEVARIPVTVSRFSLARTIVSVGERIQERHGGDPNGFFVGNVEQIQGNLMQIHGVGPGLARMMTIQRLLYFGLQPELGGWLLPKLDVHIKRVLERTGLVDHATEPTVKEALTGFDNAEIARIDQVAWNVGNKYCHKTDPDCAACPAGTVCPKILHR